MADAKGIEVVSMRGTHPVIQKRIKDLRLVALMWSDAEHTPNEFDDVDLSVVMHGGTPVAWAGSKIQNIDGQPTLKCCLNYETRGIARELGLYQLARLHRHLTVVQLSTIAARTYLFDDSRILNDHLHEGWMRTGLTGTAENGGDQTWVELHRDGRS